MNYIYIKSILKKSYRFVHMFIIAILYVVLGLLFAAVNNLAFKDIETIKQNNRTEKDKNKAHKHKYKYNTPLIILETIAWLLLEIAILLAEIYLIRNMVKIIGHYILEHKKIMEFVLPSKNKTLSKYLHFKNLLKSEYGNNIMLGYTIYLFNVRTNDKFLYLLHTLTGDKTIETS